MSHIMKQRTLYNRVDDVARNAVRQANDYSQLHLGSNFKEALMRIRSGT